MVIGFFLIVVVLDLKFYITVFLDCIGYLIVWWIIMIFVISCLYLFIKKVFKGFFVEMCLI